MKQIKKQLDISLRLENVTKEFDKIVAVNDVSFSANTGEVIALLGPNGAGKSTLMNMIAGFLSPTNGAIFVNNYNVTTDNILTKKSIGFLPEGAPMYADMRVELFLKYMIELKLDVDKEKLTHKQLTDIYSAELERIMKIAHIETVAQQQIDTLSKGYLRRVGFAQSIINNPPILLLDEPTDGLDPNQKEHMRKLIKAMGKNKTIVISTHLLEEAENIASRIIVINRGKIVADADLKKILAQTKTKTLEQAFKVLTRFEEVIYE